MFVDTLPERFLKDRKYEILHPPTYDIYSGKYNYLKMTGKFWPARVSDVIIAHKGKLFIGGGDYDKNTGATPVCSYDPFTKEWTVEANLPTEQIWNIREIDDTLWIPCIDHTGGDVDSKVFRRNTDGTWQTISIPFPAQHSFDIIKWNGKIWMDIAQAPDSNRAAVACSSDGGETWEKVGCFEPDGVTLPNITVEPKNRIESGFVVMNNELYAIDRIYTSATNRVVYKYNVAQNKFLRITDTTALFTPSGTNATGRYVYGETNRYVAPVRYGIDGGGGVAAATEFIRGDKFIDTQFYMPRCHTVFVNNAALYASNNYARMNIYSKKHVFVIPDGEALMYGFIPALGIFSSGIRTDVRDEGDYRLYSSRDIVDTCVYGNKLYVLQVSTINNGMTKISTGEWFGDLPVPINVSIYSTTDLQNYQLEFEDTFPTWPSCFAISEGYAYISMSGDPMLDSHWVGAIVKAKLGN